MKLQGVGIPVAKGGINFVEYVLVLVLAVQPHHLFGKVNPVADSKLHVKGVGVIGGMKAISPPTFSQDGSPVGVAVGGIAGYAPAVPQLQ